MGTHFHLDHACPLIFPDWPPSGLSRSLSIKCKMWSLCSLCIIFLVQRVNEYLCAELWLSGVDPRHLRSSGPATSIQLRRQWVLWQLKDSCSWYGQDFWRCRWQHKKEALSQRNKEFLQRPAKSGIARLHHYSQLSQAHEEALLVLVYTPALLLRSSSATWSCLLDGNNGGRLVCDELAEQTEESKKDV